MKILVAMVFFLIGCKDGCKPEEDRCNGNVVEICNTSHNWEVSQDCDKLPGVEMDAGDDAGNNVGSHMWECGVDPDDGWRACLLAPQGEVE
jgi:hypothetical protein